jgi:tRNA-2-methylthio-N6-dimethylallyladenosine synthase
MSTVELVRKVRYDSAFTFIYSVRKGTPAEKMTDQVPEEVKHQRFDRLLDVIHEIQEEKAAADQDALLPVLVEGFSKTDPDVLTGRTDSNKTVDLTVSQKTMDAYGIDRPGELIGRIIPVKIVKAQTFSLYGEAV